MPKIKVPVAPHASNYTLKQVYLLVLARHTAFKLHQGNYFFLKELRDTLKEFGYKHPDTILTEVHKNNHGFFLFSEKSDRIRCVNLCIANANILKYEMELDPNIKDEPDAKLNCYISEYDFKDDLTFNTFKKVYTGLIASRPSQNAHEDNCDIVITRQKKNSDKIYKKRYLDPAKKGEYRETSDHQEIDDYQGGRTYQNIADERKLSRNTVMNHIKAINIPKISRQKQTQIIILKNHANKKIIELSANELSANEHAIKITNQIQDKQTIELSKKNPNTIFVLRPKNANIVDSNTYEDTKKEFLFIEREINVPFIIKKKDINIHTIRDGSIIKEPATLITFKRDIANLYSNQTRIIDGYVFESSPFILTTTPCAPKSKIHIRRTKLNNDFEFTGKDGLKVQGRIRRMNWSEKGKAKKQNTKFDGNKNLVFTTTNKKQIVGLKIQAIETKQNKLPKQLDNTRR